MAMKQNKNEMVIYQNKTGAIKLRGDFNKETIWATQADLIRLYGKDQSVISRHIKSIFKDKEIEPKSNMQKMHIANSDKPVVFYSLDIILAVGYRTDSPKAIEFRKWATKVLRQHIVKGFTINPAVVKNNFAEFQKAIDNLKRLLPPGTNIDHTSVLELVSA